MATAASDESLPQKLERMLGVTFAALSPLVPQEKVAASLMAAALRAIPHEVLAQALTDEAAKRVDSDVDAAEDAKVGPK